MLFLVTSCGVKGDPISPKNPPMKSLMQDYDDVKLEGPLRDEHKRVRR